MNKLLVTSLIILLSGCSNQLIVKNNAGEKYIIKQGSVKINRSGIRQLEEKISNILDKEIETLEKKLGNEENLLNQEKKILE